MSAPEEAVPACLADLVRWQDQMAYPVKLVGDPEGARLPEQLPPVVDAHVHLFPERVFEAIWRWFDHHAWPVRYRLYSEQVIEHLLSRGVSHLIALHYAHTPGMARALNRYLAEVCARHPQVTGVSTVLPGEPEATAILEEGYQAGLRGVKLHCHVQSFSPDAPALHDIYAWCVRRDQPLVMHAGREPSMRGLGIDPYELCAAERVERVLQDYPQLKLCVPHLGANEYDAYQRLVERYDHLWLDTTMAVAEFFPGPFPLTLLQARPERIIYGTDFPNLPYAWDREVRRLASLELSDEAEAAMLGQNARALFGV